MTNQSGSSEVKQDKSKKGAGEKESSGKTSHTHLQFLSHHPPPSTSQSHLHQVVDGVLVT